MTAPFHLAGSEVTVFGGSGFLGRHLVQRLAAAGAVVRVAVRDPVGAAFLKPAGEAGQIVLLRADITSDEDVTAAVGGAAAVINLVGILFEKKGYSFEDVHHRGAERVAVAAKKAGVQRLVHVSAIGASRASPAEYGRTKAAGEAAVTRAFAEATILRPSVIFGPEDKFFNLFAEIARLSPVLPVFGAAPTVDFGHGEIPRVHPFGDGGPRLQPVYVGDVADAAMAALGDTPVSAKLFELGGPKVYRFKELMELLLRVTGRHRLLVPVPLSVLSIDAAILEALHLPLLTRDQVRLLRRDNVVASGAATFADLGLSPRAAEIILPTYLDRFRSPSPRRAH